MRPAAGVGRRAERNPHPDIYRYFLIFTRIGAALMVMLELGGTLPIRIRLILTPAISLVMLPVVGTALPPCPTG